MAKASPQLAPATALVQLLTEHPDLPALRWELPDGRYGVLTGTAYAADHPFEVLHAYALALGGSIRPERGSDYECAGRVRRMHHLTTTWRDVPVMVRAAATVGLCDPALRDGQLAEQRHQIVDPFEPVLPGSGRTAVSV